MSGSTAAGEHPSNSMDSYRPQPPPPRRTRRRRVAFGNPSLSVFGGFVDTLDSATATDGMSDAAAAAAAAAADDEGNGDRPANSANASSAAVEDAMRGGGILGRVVAMVDVPPEQVPEGVLNFVRAHRPAIEHVRIVTTDDNHGDGGERRDDDASDDDVSVDCRRRSASYCPPSGAAAAKSSSAPVSGNLVPSGASGVAMSYQQQQQQQQQLAQSIPFGRYRSQSFSTAAGGAFGYKADSRSVVGYGEAEADANSDTNFGKGDCADAKNRKSDENDYYDGEDDRLEALKRLEAFAAASDSDASEFDEMFDDDEHKLAHGQTGDRCKSYVVLFQLMSVEAAAEFVHDLDGRPYTTLQEDVTCCLCHVLSLRGDGGVSLMSPFFAPSSMGESSGSGSGSNAGAGTKKTSGVDFSTPTKDLALSAVRETLSSGGSKEETPSPPPAISELGGVGARGRRARSPITGMASGFAPGGVGGGVGHISEAHNCAVCLERLEMEPSGKIFPVGTSSAAAQHHGSGIITTVCNHTFHIDCLLRWQDSPCPVCRFDHSGLNEALSQCHVCGITEHNYVCLICGVVSCGGAGHSGNDSGSNNGGDPMDFLSDPGARAGRSVDGNKAGCNVELGSGTENYVENNEDTTVPGPLPPVATGHARHHYDETLHAYALDTETQHVWDFAGQGYVHRLIQSKEDGKLVEINDPSNTSSQERTLVPGLSDAQEDELLHRKLEGFASQYYTVLKGQLEQQRIFYESQLGEIRREYDELSDPKRRYAQELISALKQEKNQIEQRCLTLRRKLKKAVEDIAFLKSMNDSLAGDREPMRRQIMEAQRQRTETRDMLMKCLPPLEAKLAMLFTQLEAGGAQAAQGSAGNEEGTKPPAT